MYGCIHHQFTELPVSDHIHTTTCIVVYNMFKSFHTTTSIKYQSDSHHFTQIRIHSN